MAQTFACSHAYLTRETGENKVVLCDKAGTPDFKKVKAIIGCMCAYQPPCPEKHLCALEKGWDQCWRLQQEREARKPDETQPEQKKTAKRSKKSE